MVIVGSNGDIKITVYLIYDLLRNFLTKKQWMKLELLVLDPI